MSDNYAEQLTSTIREIQAEYAADTCNVSTWKPLHHEGEDEVEGADLKISLRYEDIRPDEILEIEERLQEDFDGEVEGSWSTDQGAELSVIIEDIHGERQ